MLSPPPTRLLPLPRGGRLGRALPRWRTPRSRPQQPPPPGRRSSVGRHDRDRREQEHGEARTMPANRAARRPTRALPLRNAPPPPRPMAPRSASPGRPNASRKDRLRMPAHVNPEKANHVATTKSPPTTPEGPRRAGVPTRSRRRGTHQEDEQDHHHHPVPGVGGQSEVDEPKTETRQRCRAQRQPAPPSVATGPQGGSSTTPATQLRAKRHRPGPPSIRSNSPSIAWPQSTRSAGSSPTAHRNSRTGMSSRRQHVRRCVLATPQHHPCAPEQQDREDRGHYAPLKPKRRRGTDRSARATSRAATYSRPVGVESIQVPGRPAGWTWLPGRFEHLTVGESDQDGIERTRFQVDFCGQVVAVAPPRRIGSQCLEDSDHLRRRTP